VRQKCELNDRLSASAGLYYDLSSSNLGPWGSLTYKLDPSNPKSKSRIGETKGGGGAVCVCVCVCVSPGAGGGGRRGLQSKECEAVAVQTCVKGMQEGCVWSGVQYVSPLLQAVLLLSQDYPSY